MIGTPPGLPDVLRGALAAAAGPPRLAVDGPLGAVGCFSIARASVINMSVPSSTGGLGPLKKDALVSKFIISKSLPTCSLQNTCSFTSRYLWFLIPLAKSAACCFSSSKRSFSSSGAAKKSNTLVISFGARSTEFLSLNTRSRGTPSASSSSRARFASTVDTPSSSTITGTVISIRSLVARSPVKYAIKSFRSNIDSVENPAAIAAFM